MNQATKQFEQDEQSEDLGDLQQQNSFQGENRVFQLRSAIHSLQIEKNKLALQHQASLASLQQKNKLLTNQNSTMKRQITKLQGIIKKLQNDNEELKKYIDVLKDQVENSNIKIADIHNSIEGSNQLGDPSQLINQLLLKQKKIQQLTKQLELSNQKLSLSSHQKTVQNQKQKQDQQIKNFKKLIEDLKKKQIDYKRQYENILQSNQEIIKKMTNQTNQNEEHSKKIIQSKDKMVSQVKKDNQELTKKIQILKFQNIQLNKIKQEHFKNQIDSQKEDLIRGVNQKLKKHLKDKQEKLSKCEQKNLDLENQFMIFKQQLTKYKAQIISLNQFNNYLQQSNKEYEENKKKLQTGLYEKQKQIGQLKQIQFQQTSQLKKAMIQQKAQIDHKLAILQQQLTFKNLQIQKYEQRQQAKEKNQQINTKLEMEKINKQKDKLSQDLEILEERYREKSEKLLNTEKRFRSEYEERITGLQEEVFKARAKMNQDEQQRGDRKDVIIQEELQEKIKQIKKLTDEKEKLQRELIKIKQDQSGLQKKLKDKNQENLNLSTQYFELNEKYKKGMKQLQNKIEQVDQQITQQKKKSQKRKLEAMQNEGCLATQLLQYKKKVMELQSAIYDYRNIKIQDAQSNDLRMKKLTQQISMINKQKQSAMKTQELKNKQKQDILLDQKNKLIEYIEQLEEDNQELNKKLIELENKETKANNNVEKKLWETKLQYSQSLKEVNLILQKYKKLEEVHREALCTIEQLKEEKESLNLKYLDIYKQKRKITDELNSSYDQINKLNLVLMSKQEQIHRYKPGHSPSFQSKNRLTQQSQFNELRRMSQNMGNYSNSKIPYKETFYPPQSSRQHQRWN